MDRGAQGDDARASRELTREESADLCRGCVRCCTYITVEIDPPRAAWEYDQWIWTLHHEGIALTVEQPERWFLHVETRCRQLDGHGRCSIHGRHPVLCRDYDPRTCERRLPLGRVRGSFTDAGQLERWVERNRPSHWRRLLAYRGRPQPVTRHGTGLSGLVRLETLALSGAASPEAQPTSEGPA
jgi:hypothetical protein